MRRNILCLAVTMVFLLAGGTILHAQDLTIAVIDCPKAAKAGQDLKSKLQLLVANTGDSVQKDITVEIVLKKSPLCPGKGRHAAYSAKYYDGVLLRQGREIITLEPGKTRTIIPYGANTIPWDTPVGRTYYLCAVIDSENQSKETNKYTNCACSPIKIIGTEEGPVVARLQEKCLVPGGSLTILGKNFGTVPGTITAVSTSGISVTFSVSSWNDSMIVVRIPSDSRMQEGQQYAINIIKNGETVSMPTGRQNIGTCPMQQKAPTPGATKTMPPFFFDQQP